MPSRSTNRGESAISKPAKAALIGALVFVVCALFGMLGAVLYDGERLEDSGDLWRDVADRNRSREFTRAADPPGGWELEASDATEYYGRALRVCPDPLSDSERGELRRVIERLGAGRTPTGVGECGVDGALCAAIERCTPALELIERGSRSLSYRSTVGVWNARAGERELPAQQLYDLALLHMLRAWLESDSGERRVASAGVVMRLGRDLGANGGWLGAVFGAEFEAQATVLLEALLREPETARSTFEAALSELVYLDQQPPRADLNWEDEFVLEFPMVLRGLGPEIEAPPATPRATGRLRSAPRVYGRAAIAQAYLEQQRRFARFARAGWPAREAFLSSAPTGAQNAGARIWWMAMSNKVRHDRARTAQHARARLLLLYAAARLHVLDRGGYPGSLDALDRWVEERHKLDPLTERRFDLAQGPGDVFLRTRALTLPDAHTLSELRSDRLVLPLGNTAPNTPL